MNDNLSYIEKAAFIGHLGTLAASPLGEGLGSKAASWGHALGINKAAQYQNEHGNGFNNSRNEGRRNDRRKDDGSKAFKDLAMVASIGGAVGLALASRKANAIRSANNERLLAETTELRGLGNKAGLMYNSAIKAKEDSFQTMFESIPDPSKRKYVQDTTKQITRLIHDTGKNSKHLDKHTAHRELQGLINQAHSADQIPAPVANYLHNELDDAFRMRRPSNPNPSPPGVGAAPSIGHTILNALDAMTGG